MKRGSGGLEKKRAGCGGKGKGIDMKERSRRVSGGSHRKDSAHPSDRVNS